jgi:hypothetical protein
MMDTKEAVLRYQAMIAEKLAKAPYVNAELVMWVNETPMFAATINGIRMVNKKGKVRLFKTADAATRAARKGAGL